MLGVTGLWIAILAGYWGNVLVNVERAASAVLSATVC